MSEDQLAVAAMAEQRRAERQVKVLGLAALFGIAGEDASTIELDFTRNPQNRRSEDLTKHTALTLRARKRFLSGRGKAVAA
ncbi:MAG: hypothetical protein Q8J79_13740 [Erythrobacter sp.]|nr:hypothetical protein [Erythrobacter sp.]